MLAAESHPRDCRCPPCRLTRAAQALRAAKRRQGFRATTSAETVRAHIENLRAKGVGRRRIATLAGLQAETIQRIMGGRRVVRVSTARKILAVKPDRADGCWVPAWRATKLVETLRADGYTDDVIKQRAAVDALAFGERIRLGVHRRIERAYRLLTE